MNDQEKQIIDAVRATMRNIKTEMGYVFVDLTDDEIYMIKETIKLCNEAHNRIIDGKDEHIKELVEEYKKLKEAHEKEIEDLRKQKLEEFIKTPTIVEGAIFLNQITDRTRKLEQREKQMTSKIDKLISWTNPKKHYDGKYIITQLKSLTDKETD